MRPVFVLSLILVLSPVLAWAQQADALRRALDARAAGDWPRAVAEARGAGAVGRDIIEWHRLRAKEGTFAEARAFLDRRPDWPGLPYLRERSEHAIAPGTSPAAVLNFFAPQLPRTGNGSLRLAEALGAAGQAGAARQEVLRGWVTHSLTPEEEAAFLRDHGTTLAGAHAERANMLLWRGLTGEALRMLPLLTAADQALTRARAGLRDQRSGVNALIDAVPASRAGDPGLAYERFLWRVRAGRTAGAIEILEAQRALGQPESWGNLRRRYARQLMREGQYRRAYALAARHGLSEGRHYADLEWLAGFIALTKRGDADTALGHFERFERAVDTPISLSRAMYWQGRAHARVGNRSAAMADYRRAAEHQTAFYGQLAAVEAGVPMDPALTGRETFPNWRNASFTRNSNYEAARLLLAAGDLNLGERFLTHLAESQDRQGVGQMAAMARDIGIPHLEVMIAKRGVQYGHVIEGPYYALHPLAERTGSVAPELALAIARRESEFDPTVVSPVGARGLMQLMPGTAQEMAGDLGEGYSARRLLTDANYNARLGLAYLVELEEMYGESPVLIAAAYNAGPSRADTWMRLRGDPRGGRVDLVDWIEHIPFRETRNYVMRVVESLAVYRARLSGEVGPWQIAQDLRGARATGAQLAPPPSSTRLNESLRPQARPFVPATR
ncbi:MAG: transglycosylase SLT domain-containing protein [Pseudomonadota bacterium]